MKKKIIAGLVVILCVALAVPGFMLGDYLKNGKKYSRADMLRGLARAWRFGYDYNAVMEIHPELDWDAEFMKYIDRILKTTHAKDYALEIAEFTAALGDGHAVIREYPEALKRGYLPIELKYIEDKILVTEINTGAEEIPLFSELVSVNGKAVAEYLSGAEYKLSGSLTPNADRQLALRYQITRNWLGASVKLGFITPGGAELIAEYLKDTLRVTVIGEKTSGAPGPYAVFPLPEGGRFRVTVAYVNKVNSSEYVNNSGVEPNIIVEGINTAGGYERARLLILIDNNAGQ